MAEFRQETEQAREKIDQKASSALADEVQAKPDPEPGMIKIGNSKDKTGGSPFDALVHARETGAVDPSASNESLAAAASKIRKQDLHDNPSLKKQGYKSSDNIRIPDELASKELKAERAAHKEFPSSADRESRALATKEKLGTITDEEKAQLDKKRFDCSKTKPELPAGDFNAVMNTLKKMNAVCEADLRKLPEDQADRYNAIVGKAAIEKMMKEPDAKTVDGNDLNKMPNHGNEVTIKGPDGSPRVLSDAPNKVVAEHLQQILEKKDQQLKDPEYASNYQKEFDRRVEEKYPGLKEAISGLGEKEETLRENFKLQTEELKSKYGFTQEEAEYVLTGLGLNKQAEKSFIEKTKQLAANGQPDIMTNLKDVRNGIQKDIAEFNKIQKQAHEVSVGMSKDGLFPPGKQKDCCCRDARQKALAMVNRIENGAPPAGAACVGGSLSTLGFLETVKIEKKE